MERRTGTGAHRAPLELLPLNLAPPGAVAGLLQAAVAERLAGGDGPTAREAAELLTLHEAGLLDGALASDASGSVGLVAVQEQGALGLIRLLYLRPLARSAAAQGRLLEEALPRLAHTASRIEWHAGVSATLDVAGLPGACWLHCHRSWRMSVDPEWTLASTRPRAGPLAIRPWQAGDFEPAVRLFSEVWREPGHDRAQAAVRDGASARALLGSMLEARLDGEPWPALSLVAPAAERSLAAFVLVSRTTQGGALAELMCVAPTWQRSSGLPYALARRVVEVAASAGVRQLVLEVARHNRAACRLYEALGFRIVGESATCTWEGYAPGHLRARTASGI